VPAHGLCAHIIQSEAGSRANRTMSRGASIVARYEFRIDLSIAKFVDQPIASQFVTRFAFNFFETSFNNRLSRDTSMVGTRDPQRLKSAMRCQRI
jgi:hypothetical protein